MSSICKRAVKCPEGADKALGVLCNRLGKITALRGNSADNGHAALISRKGLHIARALIKASESARKICRKALLCGHLLKPSRDLTKSLRPARGGVRHKRDMVAHIAVVFGNGHARIY